LLVPDINDRRVKKGLFLIFRKILQQKYLKCSVEKTFLPLASAKAMLHKIKKTKTFFLCETFAIMRTVFMIAVKSATTDILQF